MLKTIVKRAAIGAGVVVLLLALVSAGIYAASAPRFTRTYTVSTAAPPARTDSAAVARGRHLATAIGKCGDCHGEDLGGGVLVDDPLLGRLAAPNLTVGAGGVGWAYTDSDWDRAVRHGVGPTGRPLLVMPSTEYQYLSDDDMAALAAYLRQLAPVERTVPATTIRVLGRGLFLAGRLPLVAAEDIDHAPGPRSAPPAGPTAAYGEYLVTTGGCAGCHGPNLSGTLKSDIPGAPPAPNLTPTHLGSWTDADFVRALRLGRRPDGSPIDSAMPWRYTRQMTDEEIRAVWVYLQSLPARRTGEVPDTRAGGAPAG
jgi:mono/diheme cytochrome c family protein